MFPILLTYLLARHDCVPSSDPWNEISVPHTKDCNRHDFNLLFFFLLVDLNCQKKEHSTGTLDFQMSSQQEEGCGHEQKGVTSNYRTISTYELAKKAAFVSEVSLLGGTTLLSPGTLQFPYASREFLELVRQGQS